MSEWQITKLGSVGKVSMCKRVLKSQTLESGDIPFFKISTFGGKADSFISKRLYDEYRTKYSFPKRGDILISAAGTLGKTVIYDGTPSFYQDSNIVWIDNDESTILNDFLYYFYQTKPWQTTTGSTINRIYNEDLRSIRVKHPSIRSQQKIAKVLATLDAKIALNNRINAELEAMAKLLYDYWFVQFDFPMTAAQAAALGQAQLEGQPYKSSGGKMVFNPILRREIPEGWEAHTLEQALTLCYGKALKKEIQSPGPYPVYGSNGIYGYHDTPLVKGPGIIIGRKGTVGSVTWEHGDFFATDTSYYVETKAYYSMAYAFHLLKSLRLDLMNTDSAVPGLSRTYAYMRTFASPPAELVEAFTEIVAPLRDQIHINQKQNQELTTLRDWLLPMLMNGQVMVN